MYILSHRDTSWCTDGTQARGIFYVEDWEAPYPEAQILSALAEPYFVDVFELLSPGRLQTCLQRRRGAPGDLTMSASGRQSLSRTNPRPSRRPGRSASRLFPARNADAENAADGQGQVQYPLRARRGRRKPIRRSPPRQQRRLQERWTRRRTWEEAINSEPTPPSRVMSRRVQDLREQRARVAKTEEGGAFTFERSSYPSEGEGGAARES